LREHRAVVLVWAETELEVLKLVLLADGCWVFGPKRVELSDRDFGDLLDRDEVPEIG
jgi:hypothetical protein